MASLHELQAQFAAALRDPARGCAVTPAANLSVYRNNSALAFRDTLERAYPVVLRRVGAEYFRQLAYFYRERFPSRSGDLFEAGRDFPRFLAEHLGGSDYAWLADLAALERAHEEASVAEEPPALSPDALAGFAPEMLEHLTFTLQPSLRLVGSPFPVFNVWRANQAEDAPPVGQSRGGEQVLVRIRAESVEMVAIAPDLFAFLSALQAGQTLGAAMTAAAADGPRLGELLGSLFGDGLVCLVSGPAASEPNGQRVGTSS
jgi:hypothetical protein